MLQITKVKKSSIAYLAGIEQGDEILSFDGYPAEDELDLLYVESLARFRVTVKDKRRGEEHDLEIEKEENEPFGIEIVKNTSIRTCHNHCVFCFVDQMPKGMRESLYVKDDDYGMSFACGNFVTLTNLSDEGLERIIRLKLSPLYISVHTMNGVLRKELLRNRFADKIVRQIDRLCEAGVEIHAQAVIVPNKNDGAEFEYTARELFKHYPYVKDVAAVPTGITKYREGLYPIPDVDKAYSEKFLDLVDKLNGEFGVNFILPADEYFVKAERPFMSAAFYGEFEQIENGIGMTSKFCSEVEGALSALPENYRLKKAKKTLIVSGVSAAKINREIAKKAEEKIGGLTAEVLPVLNEFFGYTVTCTGLLTGQDIAKAIEEYKAAGGKFDEIVLPANTMKEFEEVFLCGMTLRGLKKRLRFKKIRVNRAGGVGLAEILSK